MKDLVIYYSWTGHTKTVASVIAKAVKGELKEIEEKKVRPKGLGFVTGAFQALFGLQSRIKELQLDLDAYHRIFLGTPIWAERGTPALNTFLAKNALSGKQVYLFFTLQDDKPPLKAVKILTGKIEEQGGRVGKSLSIRTTMGQALKTEPVEKEVKAWLGEIDQG